MAKVNKKLIVNFFLFIAIWSIGVVIGFGLHDSVVFRIKEYPPSRLSDGTVDMGFHQTELLFRSISSANWLGLPPYHVPGDIVYKGEKIVFNVTAETKDEWVYLFLDPQEYDWKNMSWEFSITRRTKFREFAFNYRYRDYDNRYRYRFEDDRIFFDKKASGVWFNNIASTPFPMEMNRQYLVRIDAYSSLFRCYVDKKLMLENVDTDIESGSISLILWEDDGKTNISAEVEKIVVYGLEKEDEKTKN